MMQVSPFRGICYNQRIVGDLARVLCPPYDVITPEQQKLYYEKVITTLFAWNSPLKAENPSPLVILSVAKNLMALTAGSAKQSQMTNIEAQLLPFNNG